MQNEALDFIQEQLSKSGLNEPSTIVIASTAKNTKVFINGRVYGEGVTKVEFSREAGKKPKISLTCAEFPLLGNGTDKDVDLFLEYVKALCKDCSIS